MLKLAIPSKCVRNLIKKQKNYYSGLLIPLNERHHYDCKIIVHSAAYRVGT